MGLIRSQTKLEKVMAYQKNISKKVIIRKQNFYFKKISEVLECVDPRAVRKRRFSPHPKVLAKKKLDPLVKIFKLRILSRFRFSSWQTPPAPMKRHLLVRSC